MIRIYYSSLPSNNTFFLKEDSQENNPFASNFLCLILCNRLCVSALAVDNFAEGVGAVYGVFDGDRNEELPRLLQCTMADVLLEELQQSNHDVVFMTNTFLVSHR